MFSITRLIILVIAMISSINAFSVKIYGHRGARGLAAEHTMYGYDKAVSAGVDVVDMDIEMTSDGVLVVTHDFTLNPDLTCDKNGQWITNKIPVRNLTLKQLKEFNVGQIKSGTLYSSIFPEQKPVPPGEDATIPTLEQVIQHVKKISKGKVGFQIEIKTDPADEKISATPKEFAVALEKILTAENIVDITEVQAFDWRCLLELKNINPKIKTAWLTEQDYEASMLADDVQVAGLWSAGHLLKNYNNSIPGMIHELGGIGSIWGPEDCQLTQALVEEAHKQGLKVVPWSYPEKTHKQFDETMMENLIKWGVDGIITDRPDLLIEVMKRHNLPLSTVYNSS
ncbi:MAG: glycerophosphodiester phosphodiesterase family protein [Endozoicomonadaceae bacterium]|nr:glycerophosphodiester phosphodiesterase family protein [Endozoicomonadaceae bacterium]